MMALFTLFFTLFNKKRDMCVISWEEKTLSQQNYALFYYKL